jgi:multidrug resistance efflux pump
MNAQSTENSHSEPSSDGQRGVRRITLVLLIVILLLMIWYLVSDRLTPYTASARLKAFVVPVVPDVSGYVFDIPIKKNQLVEAGDTLFQIEPRRFELAVKAAEAELELAGQEVGASTAAVATATAALTVARARYDEAKVQGARIFALEKKGIVARAKGDEARGIISTTRAQVEAAEAELERAKQQLGSGGEAENPRMRLALSALEEARLNLERTNLKTHMRGFVGGLKIDEGTYVNAGQPAMTFISVDDLWVEAYMTENNLGRVEPGDKVELTFDAFPGQIFEGKVKSSAAGVSTGKKTDLGDLPTVEKKRGWLRDSQRFPVIIDVTNYQYDINRKGGVRLNSQVDVIVYTGDNWFWNMLGKFWIRLMSWFSYAY